MDGIHKRFGIKRFGKKVTKPWGNYFFVPKNINEAIEQTNWKRWDGEEVMMSSTHDPYLPLLLSTTRKILQRALPNGVKFCIQTRSPLAARDFDLLKKYKDQVRVQVSISTNNNKLSRLIEPRVSPPKVRFEILEKAKKAGLDTGIIIAPFLPSVSVRPDPFGDLDQIVEIVKKIRPNYIYGESIHSRGSNMKELEIALGEQPQLKGFDKKIEKEFYKLLKKSKLKGKWWPDK